MKRVNGPAKVADVVFEPLATTAEELAEEIIARFAAGLYDEAPGAKLRMVVRFIEAQSQVGGHELTRCIKRLDDRSVEFYMRTGNSFTFMKR